MINIFKNTKEEKEIIALLEENQLSSMGYNGFRLIIDAKQARQDTFKKYNKIFEIK